MRVGIEGFDFAPSSASVCRGCGEVIKKGKLRGFGSTNYRNHRTPLYICEKCVKKEQKELEKERKELKTYTNKEKELMWRGIIPRSKARS